MKCKSCKKNTNDTYCDVCRKKRNSESSLKCYYKYNYNEKKRTKVCHRCGKMCTGYLCKDCVGANRYTVTRMKKHKKWISKIANTMSKDCAC